MTDLPPLGDLAATDTTDDVFLGGRLRIRQPSRGYRAGLDAVLLAAACPVAEGAGSAPTGVRVLDAGAGVGVVGLCIANRHARSHVTLVERVAVLAALARINVAQNALGDRVDVIETDINAQPPLVTASASVPSSALPSGLMPESYHHVVANPPFQEEGRGRAPADPIKAGANAMPAGDLDRWARFLARMAAPGGSVTLIHRADALAEVLGVLAGRFGAIEVLPVHPREGAPSHRIVVRGRKGSRAPLTLLPGLVLHGRGNAFEPLIEAVLRDGAPLPPPWGRPDRQGGDNMR